ncbi:hypothetical protein GDO78_009184 [Eleutherodactylus coqui]|uniref:Uncharacterized protein n=1 Tax=Eleutherodactylus coqui TaxID=57060 RepID=A0A8J6FAK4_ELECQ|nr:hypothetical protein GDO78_009184 [Eleutherodactylus coqui]
MEYCVQFWTPVLRKDVVVNGRTGIPRKAIKIGIIYPWKKRRLRGDQITMYKYMRGQYKDLSQDLFIARTAMVTRGHPLRLDGEKKKQNDGGVQEGARRLFRALRHYRISSDYRY